VLRQYSFLHFILIFELANFIQAVKDFLMQCFQKDPNLRVSARKLLKHPWIVNARRTESVIPKKSTEYEEAVKSVQEWNEALRSPEAGTTKRKSKPENPGNPGLPSTRNNPLADSLPSPTSVKPDDRFRSPKVPGEDNWDDDFASAISPSALKLPHLRPHDNFGGMLSSEKLKAFASLDGTILKADDSFDCFDDASVFSDDVQTIRPYPAKTSVAEPSKSRTSTPPLPASNVPVSAMQNVPILAKNPMPKRHRAAERPAERSTNRPALFTETSVDDYSDLIMANEDVLDRRLGGYQVIITCLLPVFSIILTYYRTLRTTLHHLSMRTLDTTLQMNALDSPSLSYESSFLSSETALTRSKSLRRMKPTRTSPTFSGLAKLPFIKRIAMMAQIEAH
jgi:serine/threonine protein kinase